MVDLVSSTLLVAAALFATIVLDLLLLRHLWLVGLTIIGLSFVFPPADQARFIVMLLGLLTLLRGAPLALGLLRPGDIRPDARRHTRKDAGRDLADATWQVNPSAAREDRPR
jgi:hypothetical protein